MKIKMTIEMPFKDNKEMEEAYESLLPELEFKGRAKIGLEKLTKEAKLIITITAEDLASLHAAAGSQLRALKVITGVQNFADD